jgi:hypothetical protein
MIFSILKEIKFLEFDMAIGSVVCLNSGSSNMLVKDFMGDRVICIWIGKDSEIQEVTLPSACVTVVVN